MNLLGSKVIETDRLILRPTEESDLKTLWQILCISEVNRYYLTSKLSYNWEDEKIWQYKKLDQANNNDVFRWSIIRKEDNKCIGQISVHEKEDSPVDIRGIGWFIDPKEQRKGYAYETASNIINYMFKEVGIRGIETSSAVCNPASFKLMEKLGFKRRSDETHKQKYTFVDELIDCYSYAITKEEFLKKGDVK